MTGDVWQTQSCKRYRFPALSVLHRQISKQTGVALAPAAKAREELGCE